MTTFISKTPTDKAVGKSMKNHWLLYHKTIGKCEGKNCYHHQVMEMEW